MAYEKPSQRIFRIAAGDVGSNAFRDEYVRHVATERDQYAARLAEYVASAPLCEDHKPNGGARSGCLVCGLIRLSYALSRIDYACGEPNEYEVSGFDVHCNEEVVLGVVQEKMQRLAEAEAYIEALEQNLNDFVDLTTLDEAIAWRRDDSAPDERLSATPVPTDAAP